MKLFSRTNIVFVLFFCFISFFYFHYSQNIRSYSQYPWWHQLENDIDGAHVANTVAILNGERYEYVYHPAATLFLVHGSLYRLRAIADDAFHEGLYLTNITNLSAGVNALKLPVQFSRWLLIPTHVFLAMLLLWFFYVISEKLIFSVLGALVVSISRGHMVYLTMIRAEDLTLICLLISALFGVSYFKGQRKWWKLLLGGSFLSLALFAKIQVLPVIITLVIIFTLLSKQQVLVQESSSKQFWISSLLLAVTIPWWVFMKPKFLNEEFFASLSKYSDLWKVYGTIPDYVLVYPIVLLVIPMLIWFVGRLLKLNKRWLKSLSYEFNLIILGGMMMIYGVFAPISTHFEQYRENTQHMVYATITNIQGGGYLQNRSFEWSKLDAVIGHINREKILNIPFASLLLVVIIYLLFTIGFKSYQRQNVTQELILFFMMLCTFSMDFLAAMRSESIYSYYLIYTFTFYAIAVVVLLSLLWPRLSFQFKNIKVFQLLILILLASHCVFRLGDVFNQPQQTVELTNNPATELMTLRSHAEPFFRVIDQKLLTSS